MNNDRFDEDKRNSAEAYMYVPSHGPQRSSDEELVKCWNLLHLQVSLSPFGSYYSFGVKLVVHCDKAHEQWRLLVQKYRRLKFIYVFNQSKREMKDALDRKSIELLFETNIARIPNELRWKRIYANEVHLKVRRRV